MIKVKVIKRMFGRLEITLQDLDNKMLRDIVSQHLVGRNYKSFPKRGRQTPQ